MKSYQKNVKITHHNDPPKIFNFITDWEILYATLPLKARVCSKIWAGTTKYDFNFYLNLKMGHDKN